MRRSIRAGAAAGVPRVADGRRRIPRVQRRAHGRAAPLAAWWWCRRRRRRIEQLADAPRVASRTARAERRRTVLCDRALRGYTAYPMYAVRDAVCWCVRACWREPSLSQQRDLARRAVRRRVMETSRGVGGHSGCLCVCGRCVCDGRAAVAVRGAIRPLSAIPGAGSAALRRADVAVRARAGDRRRAIVVAVAAARAVHASPGCTVGRRGLPAVIRQRAVMRRTAVTADDVGERGRVCVCTARGAPREAPPSGDHPADRICGGRPEAWVPRSITAHCVLHLGVCVCVFIVRVQVASASVLLTRA